MFLDHPLFNQVPPIGRVFKLSKLPPENSRVRSQQGTRWITLERKPVERGELSINSPKHQGRARAGNAHNTQNECRIISTSQGVSVRRATNLNIFISFSFVIFRRKQEAIHANVVQQCCVSWKTRLKIAKYKPGRGGQRQARGLFHLGRESLLKPKLTTIMAPATTCTTG